MARPNMQGRRLAAGNSDYPDIFAGQPSSNKVLVKQIVALFRKDLLLEWRQKHAINGIFLYLASTVMVCYLSFNLKMERLNPITWNALFWIILLFVAVNAVAKSFMQESRGRFLYYYQIARPEAIILSKILYNAFLMVVLAALGLVFYGVVMGLPVQDPGLFAVVVVLAALGFSSALTLVSGIASKAGNNPTLVAILGFPVIIPLLLMVIKISKNALDGLDRSVSSPELLILLAINLIIGTVSYLLFPYLWRS
jgi:heme exporter protein B